MLSDFIDLKTYSKKEAEDENNFISKIKQEIKRYKVGFEYVEVKNKSDLKRVFAKYTNMDVVVFNWCEFLNNKEGTAHMVTEFLEDGRYIFTGADTRCLLLTGSKEKTKKMLIQHHIHTPKYAVIDINTNLINTALNFPLMLKLEDRHSSAGITNENIVYNIEQFSRVSKSLINEYQTKVIAEEFIDGQEYTVTVWGNGSGASILTCAKLNYRNKNISKTYTQSSKENIYSDDFNNTIITVLDRKKDRKSIEFLSETVLNSYRALQFVDYGRFELIEREGIFSMIDCNPNQYIGYDSFLYHGSKQFGYNFGETLLQICEFAVKRSMS